jgi:hypothetical protein
MVDLHVHSEWNENNAPYVIEGQPQNLTKPLIAKWHRYAAKLCSTTPPLTELDAFLDGKKRMALKGRQLLRNVPLYTCT